METGDSYAALQDARKLEEMKFTEWLNESATKRESDIFAARQRMAASGVGRSPMAFTAEVHILLSWIEVGVDKAMGFRRELAARVPALLTPDELRKLEARLTQFVDAGINGIKQRSTMQPRGSGGTSVAQELAHKATGIKARLKRKLAALPLEARLGMHEPLKPTTTVNIANSTIGNLNLGTVVGDLNSSIQQLSTAGNAVLADGFKQLTEAIIAAKELNDSARKELLEHLSMVSDEAAKATENRKMGPLRTSIGAISSGLTVATQAMTLWEHLEKLLKAAGII